jgi:hypothetical protein
MPIDERLSRTNHRNTPYTRSGLVIGALLSVPCIVLCVILAGAAHGTSTPLIVCFPYRMLLGTPMEDIAPPLLFVWMLIQLPAYGALLGWSRSRPQSWRVWLALSVIHVSAVVIALSVTQKGGRLRL